MSELLTMQDLANGHLDVKALGEAANGDENTIVTTRTGNTYPSAERAINIMFQNGGLPATPFATLVKMQTDGASLAEGQLAQVYNEAANNGLYVKEAGGWVKSAYDPLTQAKSYTDLSKDLAISTAVNEANDYTSGRFDKEVTANISSLKSNALALLLDSNGVPVVRVATDGDMQLSNMDSSVQKAIAENTLKTEPLVKNDSRTAIAVITDKLGTPVVTIRGNGDVHFSGVDRSIREIAADAKNGGGVLVKDKYDKEVKKFNDTRPFLTDFNNALQTARNSFQNIAPVPKTAAQQDFDIGTAWVNQVTLTTNNPADRVPIAGYDPKYHEDIGVVHPYVISFDEQVAGYKYWMVINPYTDDKEDIEIPFIYGTNDIAMRDWTLIEGFPAPFEQDPVDEDGSNRGFLSDPSFTYDPINGDLICIWRKNLYYPAGITPTSKIGLNARSFDGQNWSEIFPIMSLQSEDNMLLSPTFLYNPADGLFYMYTLDMTGNLFYRTTSDIRSDNWSEKTLCVVTGWDKPTGWHAELKFVGKQVVLLLHADESNGLRAPIDAFYFGVSSDFKNFFISSKSIVTNLAPTLYKASFLPIFTGDDTAKFRIVYTDDLQVVKPWWSLYVTDTNTVNIGV